MHLWDFSTPQSTPILLHIKKEYVPAYALCTANCLFRSLYEHCTFIAHELYVDSNLQERYWFISSKSRGGQRKNSGWKGEGCRGGCADCCRLSTGRVVQLLTSVWKAVGGLGSSIYMSVGVPCQSEGVWDIMGEYGVVKSFCSVSYCLLFPLGLTPRAASASMQKGRCRGSRLAGLGSGQDRGWLGIGSSTMLGTA